MTAEPPTVATTDDADAIVSRNVLVELARQGLKQNDLAERANRGASWLNARIRGGTPWKVSDVTLLARHLDVPLSTLLPDPDPLED